MRDPVANIRNCGLILYQDVCPKSSKCQGRGNIVVALIRYPDGHQQLQGKVQISKSQALFLRGPCILGFDIL